MHLNTPREFIIIPKHHVDAISLTLGILISDPFYTEGGASDCANEKLRPRKHVSNQNFTRYLMDFFHASFSTFQVTIHKHVTPKDIML